MSQTPSLSQVIESAINERLDSFWTAVPARVLSFDSSSQTASIRIQVANADQDGAGEKRWYFPVVHKVPVVYPGGDGASSDQVYRITFPISKINNGLFIVSSLSTKRWFANNGTANIRLDDPSENRNTLSSGFLIPGLAAKVASTEVPDDAMVLWGDKVKIGGATDTQPTLKAFDFQDELGTVMSRLSTLASALATYAGAPTVPANVTALQTACVGILGVGGLGPAISDFNNGMVAGTYNTVNTEVK